MCIRDRPGITQELARYPAIPILYEFFADRFTILLDDSKRAVSYTHLRAHETVLDLVCRLLLEKKKTCKKNTYKKIQKKKTNNTIYIYYTTCCKTQTTTST